jgi:low temperature requirement protein LtrA
MGAFDRFLEPPRLRTTSEDEDRRATWLELFFDLVFVAAIAELSYVLLADVTVGGFARYLGYFVPIWWAWMGFTFYANRFDTDDLPYRLLTLAGMLGIAALAVNVRHVLEGPSAENAFVLSYVAIRLVLLVLYARARRHVERARPLATVFLTLFGLAVLVWLASLFVAAPWRYVLWAVALGIELVAPLRAWRLIRNAPIHARHIPERFGLLTIIVLGESVFAVVVGTANVQWHVGTALTAIAGFVIAASLWWLYFDFLDSGGALGRGLLGGLVFTYTNFLIVAGLGSLGTGVKLAIFDAAGRDHYADTSWVMCAGMALFLAGLGVIHLVTPPTRVDLDVALRFGSAAYALALVPLVTVVPPAAIAWLLAAAGIAQVGVELFHHGERSAEAAAQPT